MKILQSSFLGLGILMSALSLSSCAKYKAQPLAKLATFTTNENAHSAAFAHKALNKAECKRYLDRDVLDKGYQPVQITISNNTNRHINFSKSNISLETVSADYVGKKVHTSTVARATSYGVAGVFLWPFIIPAVVDGVGSAQANDRLDEDFSRKELCDQIISPFTTINGLIFVPVEKFDHEFSITLVDAKNHDKFVLSTGNPYLKI